MKRPVDNVAERSARDTKRLEREEDEASKRIAARLACVQGELAELESEYSELSDIWKQVDSKAQVTAAATGVFLGGVFAILRPPMPRMEVVFDRWLLVGALIALFACVACAFFTLALRKIASAPRGTNFQKYHDLLYRSADFAAGGTVLDDRAMDLKMSQLGVWREVNKTIRSTLESKALWTMRAHLFFGLGALAFTVLSLNQVLKFAS